jgi:tRNA(Ile)-lysidine synthase
MAANTEFILEALLDEAWPSTLWRDTHVVLAVSGGADSVALLRGVLALKTGRGGRGDVQVAHLNHGLRGPAADADQAWVEQLCGRLGVPLSVGRADVKGLANKQGNGWEAAARSARYDFLRATAERIGARFVAAAHTADDQAETVLHRIVRGTGLSGLAGMPVSRPLSPSVTLVRPLLAARRSDVLDYLAAIGQAYCTDDTNADLCFTRNRIRHELLPQLRNQFNPEADMALLRLASQASETQRWLGSEAAALAEKSVVTAPSGDLRIDCQVLFGQPTFLIREVFKVAWSRADWPLQSAGFEVWEQLAKFVQAGPDTAALQLPGDIRAIRKAGEVILSRAGSFS